MSSITGCPCFRGLCHTTQTTYFDLYQLHSVTSDADVDAALDPTTGCLAYMLEAKAAGLIKHIGFSAHDEDVAVRLIEEAPAGALETVMFPLNYFAWQHGLGAKLVAAAAKKNMGIIALKAMARGRLTTEDVAAGTAKCVMDLSNELEGGKVADAAEIVHVPQSLLTADGSDPYKYNAAVLQDKVSGCWCGTGQAAATAI